jgi:hypothetical protein
VDIGAWLRELGLERYEHAFRENEIDAEILPKLTADDLKDIGVTTVGHRRKLLDRRNHRDMFDQYWFVQRHRGSTGCAWYAGGSPASEP